jgi:cyclopropane fatty-acyl-phospholipid synthase-like methyltransferase
MFQINWKLKALLYKVFGIFGLKIFFIQKYITQRSKVEIEQINKSWVHHADSIQKNKAKNILEIGAGKSLEQNIYISYRFNNSIDQTAIDINKMIDLDYVNQASEQIAEILKLKSKGKVSNLKDLQDLYKIKYMAPFSLKNLKDKYDMCISTTALEHFKIPDLKEYLSDTKDILKTNGLVSSIIDYSDHYSHTDYKISNLNYLSYSKNAWEKYNNQYLYQNRLRHQDYIKIFETSGYKIKEIFLGNTLVPPKVISNEFDENNKDTFLGWAYFLMGEKSN